MAENGDEKCHALTNAGTRCSRLAKDGRFCFQHDETDKTINSAPSTSEGYINVVSEQLNSASAELSGASQDVAQNVRDIVNETGDVGAALRSWEFGDALGGFKRAVGKTGPTAGTGALVGGVLGSPFGPAGIAAGVSVGSWYGVYRSIDDDRAVAASVAEDVPDDAPIVSSENTAIAGVDPIQMAIQSAVETEEEGSVEWLRSTLTRERDMDSVADSLDQVKAYERTDEATKYFIRDEQSGDVLLLIFGVPQDN